MPQRHGNVGERGKGEKGGKRLTACAEKGTKCDCSSIVPLLVSDKIQRFELQPSSPAVPREGQVVSAGHSEFPDALVQRCSAAFMGIQPHRDNQ